MAAKLEELRAPVTSTVWKHRDRRGWGSGDSTRGRDKTVETNKAEGRRIPDARDSAEGEKRGIEGQTWGKPQVILERDSRMKLK